ncbi:MAG: hypothetical protein ABI629_20555, partial [bacterium]
MTMHSQPTHLTGLRRSRLATIAAALLMLGTGRAGALVIDDFSTANTTALPPGITQSSVGATTVVDGSTAVPLSGVIGGVRELKLEATSIGANDSVTIGIFAPATLVDYSSTVAADGRVTLTYSAGSTGLNVDFSMLGGVRFRFQSVDAASIPTLVQLTLTDTLGATGSVSQSLIASGPQDVDLSVQGGAFAGIDLHHVKTIKLFVDPNVAGDLRFDLIETFPQVVPTPTNTATVTATGTATQTRTPTATASLTRTATATSTATRTATNTATFTATYTQTPTATASFTNTATLTPTNTGTITATATGTATLTPTATASFTNTATQTPTHTNTGTATLTPTATASSTGTATLTPTNTNTVTPTNTGTATLTPT